MGIPASIESTIPAATAQLATRHEQRHLAAPANVHPPTDKNSLGKETATSTEVHAYPYRREAANRLYESCQLHTLLLQEQVTRSSTTLKEHQIAEGTQLPPGIARKVVHRRLTLLLLQMILPTIIIFL